MVYFQWIQLIKELPISWMPESVLKGWQVFSHKFKAVTGRAASLDCMFQAWDLWQDDTMTGIATAIFTKAAFRYVLIMSPEQPQECM
jgi:hypothetical protein